ncbi:MAG: hypothetical protein AB3N10_02040 [Allomuricauda sp.]
MGSDGVVHVKCNEGYQIFFNDDFKGESSAELGGLVVSDLISGNYEIEARREGFPILTGVVEVSPQSMAVVELTFIEKVDSDKRSSDDNTPLDKEDKIILNWKGDSLRISSVGVSSFDYAAETFSSFLIGDNVPAGFVDADGFSDADMLFCLGFELDSVSVVLKPMFFMQSNCRGTIQLVECGSKSVVAETHLEDHGFNRTQNYAMGSAVKEFGDEAMKWLKETVADPDFDLNSGLLNVKLEKLANMSDLLSLLNSIKSSDGIMSIVLDREPLNDEYVFRIVYKRNSIGNDIPTFVSSLDAFGNSFVLR